MALLRCAVLPVACVFRAAIGATSGFGAPEGAASAAPTGFNLVSRVYVPYNGNPTSLAYGMGACEQIAYDPVEKYAYAASEQGYINVIDFSNPASPEVTAHGIDFEGAGLTDVELCGGHLFVGMPAAVKTDPGMVKIYTTVRRSAPAAPVLKSTVTVGALPDMLLPNKACNKIAVANEGEGAYSSSSGLTDPVGSVTIISDITEASPTTTTVDFGALCSDDADCIAKGVHLPLPLKAMEYFDDHSSRFSGDLNFSVARARYVTASQLEPEYVAWSADDSTVYVNLQENSALVTIDVAAGTATSINSYGLKDWSSDGTTLGIDTVSDGTCVLEHKPGFRTMRTPDSIKAFEIDGTMYIATANEGDDIAYGKFEEKQKFEDVIDSASAFDNDFAEFVEGGGSPLADAFANFGGTKMRITIGSSAVDYSNSTAPVFNSVVGIGGRGVSIYRASDMSLVWDSGSDLEKYQCEFYPWSHNSIQDEEFSPNTGAGNDLFLSLDPVSDSGLIDAINKMNDPLEDGCVDGDGNGNPGACPMNYTVDERSLKDGAAAEAVVVGSACGRTLLVTATEKQGTAFVYDISDPASTTFLFAQHLTPVSRLKNVGAAYADGTLGDVDPESSIFLTVADSPTGKAGVMFAGAWSGTISFYEFADCEEAADASSGLKPSLAMLFGAILAVALHSYAGLLSHGGLS